MTLHSFTVGRPPGAFDQLGWVWWITGGRRAGPNEETRAPTEAERVLMQKVVDRTATMADSAELRRLLASYQSLATVVAGDAERPGDRPHLDVSSLNSGAGSSDSAPLFGAPPINQIHQERT
jgi:hypothetical protein